MSKYPDMPAEGRTDTLMATAPNMAGTVLAAALDYAAKGWPVFPCRADNKRPHLEHGFKDASIDPDTIRAWWRRWPDAMVAAPTGPTIGAWVLDVDDPATFETAAAGMGLSIPETRRCATGKGYHAHFAWDGGSPVRNAQQSAKGWPFPSLPGAEVRGDGGYVILPPSRHPSGRHYAWSGNTEPSTPPAELLAIVRKVEKPAPQPAQRTETSSGRQMPSSDHPYAVAALRAECAAIRAAPAGAQESTLNAAALKIGSLVGGNALSFETAAGQLVAAGLSLSSVNAHDPWTPQTVAAKVDRALRGGMATPRAIPEGNARSASNNRSAANGLPPNDAWANPKPLPDALLPVPVFDPVLLPDAFRPWIADIAERMQVPGEFVAVPAMVAAGSVIGNRLGICPERRSDWRVVPNVWGLVIGRPGAMKSPCISQALAPLSAMEGKARHEHGEMMKAWDAGEVERELRADARKKTARAALSKNPNASLPELGVIDAEPPRLRRYVANDTSYQALGELLIDNPTGMLLYRDELVSLLRALDRDDASEARGFYLTGADGVAGYTFDRILRGKNLHIPAVTVAMLGSAQPGTIRAYAAAAIRGGRGDDGMIQRFGMLVWPDLSPDWQANDRWPDAEARATATRAFERLDSLTAQDVDAECDRFDTEARRPFLRFNEDAQAIFSDWRQEYETRLRSGERHPALESHVAKYRKLIPSLALIHHLVDGGTGPVGEAAILSALAWSEFLEAHAERFYAAASNGAVEGAATILRHIRRGTLGERFTARDVHKRDWSGLTEREKVGDALEVLEEHGFIRAVEQPDGERGRGRPSAIYVVNPKGLRR